MGTDYGGAGPLYALGNGTVTNLYNSGWPGGTFLTVHLDSGQYIYYAEDIAPLVSVGQKVSAGQHIANATGGSSGIEVGWAAAPGTGAALAATSGQSNAGESQGGDPGEFSTAYGIAMSNVIAALGGPAGKVNPPIQGTVPSDFLSALSSAVGKAITGVPSSVSATLDSSTSGIGSILSWPGQITGFFSDADTFVTKLAWIVEPGSWLRIGSFLIAILLVIGAIMVFAKVDQKLPSVMPVPV